MGKFYCRTLPKILSFSAFCGYLAILIIVKFISPFDPSIINIIVGMFTDPFNADNFFYPGQLYIQMALFSTFVICVPWMMCSYPILLILKKRNNRKKFGAHSIAEMNANTSSESKEESLMETAIHIAIDAIEFNLGLISNISSYLRIWA